jgi:hypothetical protein
VSEGILGAATFSKLSAFMVSCRNRCRFFLLRIRTLQLLLFVYLL